MLVGSPVCTCAIMWLHSAPTIFPHRTSPICRASWTMLSCTVDIQPLVVRVSENNLTATLSWVSTNTQICVSQIQRSISFWYSLVNILTCILYNYISLFLAVANKQVEENNRSSYSVTTCIGTGSGGGSHVYSVNLLCTTLTVILCMVVGIILR